jgi:hypothetical protein
MAYLELISCRLAIQVRVGYSPSGKEKHRTFSLKNISPDAGAEAIAAVVGAVAPLLKYPVTKVRRVAKYRLAAANADDSFAAGSPKPFRQRRTYIRVSNGKTSLLMGRAGSAKQRERRKEENRTHYFPATNVSCFGGS